MQTEERQCGIAVMMLNSKRGNHSYSPPLCLDWVTLDQLFPLNSWLKSHKTYYISTICTTPASSSITFNEKFYMCMCIIFTMCWVFCWCTFFNVLFFFPFMSSWISIEFCILTLFWINFFKKFFILKWTDSGWFLCVFVCTHIGYYLAIITST